MKLTTRLNLFFLATLAVVLVGFSFGLYYLARSHLQQQAGDRLEAVLNTLAAAAEVDAQGVEWEPTQRHLNLGPEALGEHVVWLVTDGRGKVVDRSRQPDAEDFFTEWLSVADSSQKPTNRHKGNGELWQSAERLVQPRERKASSNAEQKDDGQKYAALTITAGVSLEPVRASLKALALVLTFLTLGIWLASLGIGRLICRRALLPVTRMAGAARAMNVEDLQARLPAPCTGDELEDLSLAFNNLLDRLQESYERQKRFTGDASHQLRTLLAAILGQIEVALRRERAAAEYRQVLVTVQQKAGHLRRIIEALLFLARADAEAALPQRESIPLGNWLDRHLESWSGHERAHDIVFNCLGGGPWSILAQPALLEELVNILLDNACKFSLPGTPIAVEMNREDNAIYLKVIDQGWGIRPADLSHLFTPFFRSQETLSRGIAGIGLGLSIARRLAGTCGCEIIVTSEVGKGSSFTLKFPMDSLTSQAVSVK